MPGIVKSLGLGEYINICVSSACVGYEKLNPKIFRIALEAAGNPDKAWMVGDSIKADVKGAENCSIKGILVRKQANEPVKYSSHDLLGVIEIIRNDRVNSHFMEIKC